jgi:hypothetical protein
MQRLRVKNIITICKYFLLLIFLFFSFITPVYAIDITLQWAPNNESNLAGYRVFYHEESQSYNYLDPYWETIDPICTIYDLDETKTYYFVVRAFSTNGFESGDSNEVCLESTPVSINKPPVGSGGCTLDGKFEKGTVRVAKYLYTDRGYTITGGVPDWMVGRTLIQTPNDERSNNYASGYFRFTSPVSYWVYVLFDSRSASIPDWLKSWELRSQYQMKTSLSSQPYLKFYRKWFNAGQCVDLGGNYGPGSSSETRSNYVVVYVD